MEKVNALWALRYATKAEREAAANDKANYTHFFLLGGLEPERFHKRAAGTLEEMLAVQAGFGGNGYIQELDWNE